MSRSGLPGVRGNELSSMNLLCVLVLGVGPATVIPIVQPSTVKSGAGVDEPELIRRAIAGQRSAQHALYVQHYERVRTRIARLLGQHAEVDDVLQDCFVAAFRDLTQLSDTTRFGNWLCGIAVHQVHRRLRRRKLLARLGFTQLEAPTLHEAADPAAGPETRLLLKQLDRALSTLGSRKHIAWMLRHVEGCSLEEVAEQCRTSLATAKRDITQAEAQLTALMVDQGGPHER
jgi:RNA polymerase sigma-70 factor, ECF subfamily